MEFLKLDPDIDSNPEIMRAGWWGARFYELLLKVAAKKDLRGRIPPDYQDLEWLARIWNLGPGDMLETVQVAAIMARALDSATRAGLITRDGGDWVLRGWEKYYRPAKTGAERMASLRQRQKPSDEPTSRPVTRDASDESDATPHTPRTSHTPPTHDVRAPAVPEKPTKDDDAWDGLDFWAWAQAKRQEGGLQPERPPNERTVSAWWNRARMQGVAVKQLRLAFIAFGNDPYWTDRSRKPPVPFGGFVSQWERFVSPEVGRVA